MLDITCLFTFGVLLVPLIYVDGLQGAISYFAQPSVVMSIAVLIGMLYCTHWTAAGRKECVPLNSRDRRVAYWFLCNGVYFNLFFDVIAGQFQSMGEMSRQYLIVEPRYSLGLFECEGVSVFMTSILELLFQSPLCLAVYWAYHRNRPYRRVCELAVCILHTAGVWFFYVPEFLRGFPHLKPDYNLAFSFDMILYFWFGFWFCGLLWIIVPMNIAYTAGKEIAEKVQIASTVTQKTLKAKNN